MGRSSAQRRSKARNRPKTRTGHKTRKKNSKKTRPRTRRKGTRSKTRTRRSKKGLRPHGLVEAVRAWLPGQFFSQWKVTSGSTWTPHRLFWMAILMVWSAEQTLGERFHETRRTLRGLFPKWSLGTSYTGWYQAQAKWITLLQWTLTERLQQHMQRSWGKSQFREGWCAFAVDGSRVECPRTKVNKKVLGCAGRKRTSPQLFVTTLWHMGLGIPWDFRIGPGKASERGHMEEMLASMPRHSLVVGDAGFTGYDFYQAILKAQHSFLLRVGANVHLLRELGYYEQDGRAIVYLWPDKQRCHQPLVLRLIKLKKGKQQVYLVTNVMGEKALSNKSAGVLYEMRWGVEIFYRSLKQTMQRRKMLSRTAEPAKCEMVWTMFGMWLLALIGVTKMIARGADPLSWSVALARKRVRQSIRMAIIPQFRDHGLSKDLGRSVKDEYERHGSKKARDWPHKKNDPPPGAPKISLATPAERRAAQRIKAKAIPK
jgi:hypothetical protein